MGTDVHGVFQAKRGDKWEDVESIWEQDRHYALFAWLAGVRNGYGFAGIPTHAPLIPLAEGRGLPVDFKTNAYGDQHPSPLDAEGIWMGDHSHTWLTADEILSATPPTFWRTGVVTKEWFLLWDGTSAPEGWSGSVSGGGVRTDDPVHVTAETTHVRIYWKERGNGFDYFLNEVRRLKDLHGEVRLVVGFDS